MTSSPRFGSRALLNGAVVVLSAAACGPVLPPTQAKPQDPSWGGSERGSELQAFAPPSPTIAPPPATATDPAKVSLIQKVMISLVCPTATRDCPYVSVPNRILHGFGWGMSHVDITEMYNRNDGIFDKEANPVLAGLPAGSPAQRNVESARDEKKQAFSASYTVFGATPSGYDNRAIHDEFTYRNGEAVQDVIQGGTQRYFFYIHDKGPRGRERLFKVWDQIPYSDQGILGSSFVLAVAKLNKLIGSPGKYSPAAFERGIYYPTVLWERDPLVRLRALDLGASVALVFEDPVMLAKLPEIRKNKAIDPFEVDPSVRSVISKDPNENDAGTQFEF